MPFKIAELSSSVSLCPSFLNIYLFLDIYILIKFPEYNMKDETSKLIQKMKPGKQGLNRIVENKSLYAANWT